MNEVIKSILDARITKENQMKALDILSDQIDMARKIVTSDYKYCPMCDDYYLTESFIKKTECHEIKGVCNKYGYKLIGFDYEMCPKGHKNCVGVDGKKFSDIKN